MKSAIVSTLQGLETAIRGMREGGTIYLQPGDYGRLLLNDFNPTGRVTITSLRSGAPAHFDGITVQRSSLLTFSSLDVGQSANAAPVARGTVSIGAGEVRDVVFTGLTLHGNGNGDPTDDPMAIRIRSSQRVEVSNSTFVELHRAVVANNSDDIKIFRNSIENMSEDGLNFGDVQGLYIKGNLIGNYTRILDGQHPDGIQIQTAGTTRPSRDIFISDNVIYQGEGQVIQGIFMGNEIALPYENVNITNNLIFTQQYHGISVGIAKNVNIANNSVLSTPGDAPYSWIMLNKVSGATVTGNVAEDFLYRDSTAIDASDNLNLTKTSLPIGSLLGRHELFPKQELLILPDQGFQGAEVGVLKMGTLSSALAGHLRATIVEGEQHSASMEVRQIAESDWSFDQIPTELISDRLPTFGAGLGESYLSHWNFA